MSSKEGGKAHWTAIDGLRAIAIIPVVLFHAGLPVARGGFVGVDVFFVISGFLITHLLLDEVRREGRIDLAAFYERRARRILPGLVLMMLVVAILGASYLSPIMEQQDLGKSMIATSLFCANVYFWRSTGGYFDGPTESRTLLNTWSLGVEEQFYLVWPFLLIIGLRVAASRGWSARKVFLAIAVTILATSFALCVWWTEVLPSAAFFLTPARAWELMIGCCLAFLVNSSVVIPRIPLVIAAWLGLAGIGFSVATFDEGSRFPGVAAALPALATAAVILAIIRSPAGSYVGRLLSLGPIVLVGQLSYSWYLWHWPLLAIARSARLGAENQAVDLWVALGSLLPAWLAYRFVEQPLRFWKGTPVSANRSRVFGASLVSCIAVILIGAGIGIWAKYFRAGAEQARISAAGASDTPRPVENCLLRPPFKSLSPQSVCLLGTKGPPEILLWGDSHANQYAPLLVEHAERSGRPALERSMALCPPLIDYDSMPLRALSPDCRAFNDAAFAELGLLRAQGLRGVVLAARWTLYFGARPLDGTNLRRHAEMLRRRPLAEQQDATTTALARTVQKLEDMGLRVLLVGPSPEFGRSVPECVLRHETPGACSRSRQDVERYRSDALNALRALAARMPMVRLWDPVGSLCTEGECPATRAGRALYSDSNHIAASASRTLAGSAAPDLEWLVAER